MAKRPSRNQVVRSYLDYAYSFDYKERPPSMDEFLNSPTYLGNLTNGGKTIYPIWQKTLKVIAKEDSKYMIVLTGAIGTGKSSTALFGILYGMCRILCLKDPWAKFGLARGAQMSVVFFNLTKSQSESLGYKSFQSYLVQSPWFREHGIVGGSELSPRVDFPLFKYTFASPFVQGFGCLTSDTKINLLDGRESTIPEIEKELKTGKPLWVYSYDLELRQMVPGKVVFAGKTRKDASLVAIHLDNNETIRCTPDHLFLMRSGDYKPAKDLISGDSLMPLYRKYQEVKKPGRYVKGYELFHCGDGSWKRTHWVVGDFIYGVPRKLNEIYHHKDFYKTNNSPENLLKMDKQAHYLFHAHLSKSRTPALLEQMQASFQEWLKTPEGQLARKHISERTKKMNTDPEHIKKVVAGMCSSEKYRKSHAEVITRVNKDPKIIQKKREKGTFKKAGSNAWKNTKKGTPAYEKAVAGLRRGGEKRRKPREIRSCANPDCTNTFECIIGNTQRYCSRKCATLVSNKGDKNPNSRKRNPGRKLVPWNKNKTKDTDLILEKTAKKISETKKRQYRESRNHKVISVEFLSCKEDVYDITVEGQHNFALSDGIFVHNSQGENILFALIDEVDSPVASEVQREKVILAYENARRRLESRFVIKGETLGRFFLVASKQERLSFLNAFVAKYRGSKSVIVIDIPLWEAKPTTMYCGKKFSVSVGDAYNSPKILNTEEELQQAARTGYKIIQVPIEYQDDFDKDMTGSIRDIGGISSSYVRVSKLFPSESLLSKCYENTPNPVKKLTIEVGLKDNINLLDYIDLSLLRVPRNVPRYIHVDFAFSGDGDACGLGMSCVEGWKKKNAERPDGTFQTVRVPAAHTDFAMRIKGKPGDKIPLHLIRKLILDLKGIHRYNIAECTFDLLIATESDKQILERAGIACDHFSVDKNPQYYRDFSNLIAEERWSTPFHPYLHFELKNLEDDPEKNKIDHPKEVVEIEILKDGDAQEVVMVGSKDLCFTKDVKIALLDGRKLTIPDIARELKKGKELYTYSVDLSEQKVVPGRIIAAFKNGRSKELVEITLDNGEKITCTKSHPFITKDGKYIVAQNLKQGMSLLPLYLSFYKGYRLVQNPFTGKNHFEHRLFSGFSDKHLSCNKYLVHHRWNEEKRIFDILDNSPHMLQIMSHGEHSKLHALLATPEKLKKMQLAAQKVMSTLEWKEKQAEVARRAVRTRVERGSGRSWVRELKEKGLDPAKDPRMRKFAEAGGKARKGVSSWNAGLTPEADPRVKKNREKLKLVQLANIQKLKIQGVNHFICPFCEKEFKNTNECFVKYHLVICKRNQEVLTAAVCRFCGKSFSNITRGTFRGHVGSCALWSKKSNHKVVNIRPVEMTSDVYDITVEEHHNFALAAGVFVHNSDATCASVINAIQKSTAPPDVEVMAALLDKVQPKKTGFEDLWWVNSGVEKKKVDKTVPVTDPNTTYLDILKKARSIHRTF